MSLKKLTSIITAFVFFTVAIVPAVQAKTPIANVTYTITGSNGESLGSFTVPANATEEQLISNLKSTLASSGSGVTVSESAASEFGELAYNEIGHVAAHAKHGLSYGLGSTGLTTGAALITVFAALVGGASGSAGTSGSTGTTGSTGTN
jgi:hypothetical protein